MCVHSLNVIFDKGSQLCIRITELGCRFHYVFSKEFKCYLKNNPNEMIPSTAAGITSGLPVRLCQPNNSMYHISTNMKFVV